MPVGDVLVGDTRGNVEHDDTALSLDVVAVTETAELLLASGVPNVEADGALFWSAAGPGWQTSSVGAKIS